MKLFSKKNDYITVACIVYNVNWLKGVKDQWNGTQQYFQATVFQSFSMIPKLTHNTINFSGKKRKEVLRKKISFRKAFKDMTEKLAYNK
jgi:hypothetical protein